MTDKGEMGAIPPDEPVEPEDDTAPMPAWQLLMPAWRLLMASPEQLGGLIPWLRAWPELHEGVLRAALLGGRTVEGERPFLLTLDIAQHCALNSWLARQDPPVRLCPFESDDSVTLDGMDIWVIPERWGFPAPRELPKVCLERHGLVRAPWAV